MDILNSVAHLRREIGNDEFDALISSDNTEAVRQFAQELVEKSLPKEMTVGGRTYDILGFLQGGEKPVKGDVMVNRAETLNANLGQDDGEHILKYQNEIPVVLRGKVAFVFTGWHYSGDFKDVVSYIFYGNSKQWTQTWDTLLEAIYDRRFKLLRRKY